MSHALTRKDAPLLFMLLPAGAFFLAFFLLPMLRLFFMSGEGKLGWMAYFAIFTDPTIAGRCLKPWAFPLPRHWQP